MYKQTDMLFLLTEVSNYKKKFKDPVLAEDFKISLSNNNFIITLATLSSYSWNKSKFEIDVN